jgi:HK97 gp10 family phage protein
LKVHLAGFRELDKALSELPKATGKNILRRVSKGALEPMADVAAQKAPQRTGRLAFSISVGEGRTRRARTTFRSTSGIQMAMGPAGGFGGTLNYASFDEFGTIDTPAFGFMRFAWDTGAEKALDYVKDHLGAEIGKAAARVAKRKVRAGV